VAADLELVNDGDLGACVAALSRWWAALCAGTQRERPLRDR
jgi:hypothetical protein